MGRGTGLEADAAASHDVRTRTGRPTVADIASEEATIDLTALSALVQAANEADVRDGNTVEMKVVPQPVKEDEVPTPEASSPPEVSTNGANNIKAAHRAAMQKTLSELKLNVQELNVEVPEFTEAHTEDNVQQEEQDTDKSKDAKAVHRDAIRDTLSKLDSNDAETSEQDARLHVEVNDDDFLDIGTENITPEQTVNLEKDNDATVFSQTAQTMRALLEQITQNKDLSDEQIMQAHYEDANIITSEIVSDAVRGEEEDYSAWKVRTAQTAQGLAKDLGLDSSRVEQLLQSDSAYQSLLGPIGRLFGGEPTSKQLAAWQVLPADSNGQIHLHRLHQKRFAAPQNGVFLEEGLNIETLMAKAENIRGNDYEQLNVQQKAQVGDDIRVLRIPVEGATRLLDSRNINGQEEMILASDEEGQYFWKTSAPPQRTSFATAYIQKNPDQASATAERVVDVFPGAEAQATKLSAETVEAMGLEEGHRIRASELPLIMKGRPAVVVAGEVLPPRAPSAYEQRMMPPQRKQTHYGSHGHGHGEGHGHGHGGHGRRHRGGHRGGHGGGHGGKGIAIEWLEEMCADFEKAVENFTS